MTVRFYRRVLAEHVPELEADGWQLAALDTACDGMLQLALLWRDVPPELPDDEDAA